MTANDQSFIKFTIQMPSEWSNKNKIEIKIMTGAYYTEWSKPERKTPIQPCIWDSKRDTDV